MPILTACLFQHNEGKLWKDVKARLEAEGKL